MNLFRARVRSLSASSACNAEASLRRLAEKTELVAALLKAGLAPADAAGHAELNVHALLSADPPQPEALLGKVWNFAVSSGAAPAAVLEVCAHAFSEAAENARQARVHLAGPQAATKLVMALPLLALAGGYLAGYNPLMFLLGTALGWFTVLGAGALMFISQRWSQQMVTKAQRWEWFRGMAAEVMAMSLSAGQSLSQARNWASAVSRDFSADKAGGRAELDRCDQFVQLALTTGVALSGLLRTQAQRERNASREEAQMRVEKLSVHLMIPLGVCVLPAFIAVGVLPLVASVISSTALHS